MAKHAAGDDLNGESTSIEAIAIQASGDYRELVKLSCAVKSGNPEFRGIFYDAGGGEVVTGLGSPATIAVVGQQSFLAAYQLNDNETTDTFDDLRIVGFEGTLIGGDLYVGRGGGMYVAGGDYDSQSLINSNATPTQGYPVLAAGSPVRIGQCPTLASDASGVGPSTVKYPESVYLEDYVMRSASGSMTVVFDMLTADRRLVAKCTATITATAKSLRVWLEAIPATWDHDWKFARVFSITGASTVHYNTSGSRNSASLNGTVSGLEPTAASDQLAAGQVLGEID